MMSCSRVLRLLAIILTISLSVVSCTTDVDYTLGSEFIPSNQSMELRRRVYELGQMRDGGSDNSACRLSSTRLYITDSIASANLGMGYFGCEASDTFGTRRAGFMSQLLFSLSLNEDRGWGYRPIFDSMELSLYVTDFHGDTTRSQRFEVYEITSNEYIKQSQDTSFYINFDPTPYISSEPIFVFDFPDQQRGVYVGDIEAPEERAVRLQETPATRDYISRLMFLTDLDANDGFALDKDELYVIGNEEAFVEQVRGVYIMPAEEQPEGRGAVYATNLESTSMILYSRDRYVEDPTIIRDTTYMVYNFYLNPNNYDYDLEAGNVSINRVEHDYSKVTLYDVEKNNGEYVVAGGEEVLMGYVDGMGGVVTEISFSDEFIQSLADLAHENEDAVVAINQALLTIYLENSSYDYTSLDPMVITPLMDSSMSRMGMYTNYATKTAISDYIYTAESSHTLAYGGELNRSLACYTMNISSFVQSLLHAAASNCDDSGRVKLDMFSPGYTPDEESLVEYRRIYLAPDAYSLFGFKRQAVIGSDGEIDGVRNSAPIKLEMTYTVVK